MTVKEAKQAMKFYKEKLYNGIFYDKIDAFDVAISALEKQIPKKPLNIRKFPLEQLLLKMAKLFVEQLVPLEKLVIL